MTAVDGLIHLHHGHSRVLLIGDSITQGIGTKLNSYLHWNAILSEKLGEEYKTHCDNHALPENFETMDYMEFLSKRRTLMAQIIKKAFMRL